MPEEMTQQGQGDVAEPPNTRFVSKPVEIEAHRIGIDPWPAAAWEAVTRNEIRLYDCGKPDGYIIVRTLEGEMRGNHGDWLIQGTEGEFYPCKPSVFERKYQARTLLSSSRGEQGWHPIETGIAELADDTLVIVGCTQGVLDIWCGRYLREEKAKQDSGVYRSSPHLAWFPTHWRPRPSAPGSVPTSLAGQVPETAKRLVELAEHCAEGRIDGNAKDISHHPPGCPCESHLLERMQSSPQPTAGGDAPTEPRNTTHSLDTFAAKVEFVLSAASGHPDHWSAYDRNILHIAQLADDALSAERARVIEECAKASERYLRKLRGFEVDYSMEEGCGNALRALGQQDTGGAG
jgi:hypothetical protein